MDLKAIQAAPIFGGGKADTSSGIPLSYLQMTIDPDTGHLLYTSTADLKDTLEFAIVNDTNLEVRIHV